MKNIRSSLSAPFNREHASALMVPRTTARKVEPNPMMIELIYRGRYFDGPAITMFRDRTRRSYQVVGGGSVAMNSGVCRVRVVNRLTYPSSDGSNMNFGG